MIEYFPYIEDNSFVLCWYMPENKVGTLSNSLSCHENWYLELVVGTNLNEKVCKSSHLDIASCPLLFGNNAVSILELHHVL